MHHVYGEKEVGGTCVLHLSSVPFEKLGFRTDLGEKPLSAMTQPAMKAIPGVIVGLGVLLGGTYGIIRRRMENQEAHDEAE